MPDGYLPGGPYPVPPSSDDESIRTAIRDGKPEEIPGLIWGKPDFSTEGHKLVLTFAIDRKKRPGHECIPCAMCSVDHPKYLGGAVLWSPDGWLRVIGHVCAAKPEHFGEAGYRGLRKQRQQEVIDSVAFDWLHANIEVFRPLVHGVNALKALAMVLENQQQVFFRGVPALAAALAQAAGRHGGELTVVQELSGERLAAAKDAAEAAGGSAQQSRYEQIGVGRFLGMVFFSRPNLKRSRQLESVVEALNRIPPGSGEEIMLALIDQGEHEVTTTAGLVLRAMQRALKLAEECADAKQFVCYDSLASLERWGQDSRNSMQFSVRQYDSQVTFILANKSRATLSKTWPDPVDLSALRAIIDLGSQLDGLLRKRTA
jgi:hypothetical protein